MNIHNRKSIKRLLETDPVLMHLQDCLHKFYKDTPSQDVSQDALFIWHLLLQMQFRVWSLTNKKIMKNSSKIEMMNREIAIKEHERDLEIWKDWWPARIDPNLYDKLLHVITEFEDVINNHALATLLSRRIEDVSEKGYVTEDWIANGLQEIEKCYPKVEILSK